MAVADPTLSPLHRLRRFDWSRTPRSLRIGGAILSLHLILAVIGPFVAPYGYAQMGAGIPLSGMSWAHPFGVDQLGRDIFSRVIYGAISSFSSRFAARRSGWCWAPFSA